MTNPRWRWRFKPIPPPSHACQLVTQLTALINDERVNIRALAQASGVHENTIHSWLHSQRNPSIINLVAVLGALGYELVPTRMAGSSHREENSNDHKKSEKRLSVD